MTPARLGVGSFALGALMLLCACGGSNGSSATTRPGGATNPPATATSPASAATATSTAVSSAPAFTVQTSLTGTDTVSGSFAVPAAGGCAAPSDLAGSVAGHQVDLRIVAMVSQPGQSQALSPGDITVTFDADTWAVGSAANSPKPSSGSLQVNADASGAVSFQNLYLSSTSGSQSLEGGQVSWTCH